MSGKTCSVSAGSSCQVLNAGQVAPSAYPSANNVAISLLFLISKQILDGLGSIMTTYYLDNSLDRANDRNAGTSAHKPFESLAALNPDFSPTGACCASPGVNCEPAQYFAQPGGPPLGPHTANSLFFGRWPQAAGKRLIRLRIRAIATPNTAAS